MTTTTLIDTDLKSSLSQDDLYTDYWLLIPGAATADRVRVVSLYTPSSGTLTVDLAWSAITVPRNVAYELHGLINPTTDLLNAANDALKRIYLPVEVTVAQSALGTNTRYNLTGANSWLTEASWVRQCGVLASSDNREIIDPFRYRPVAGHAYKASDGTATAAEVVWVDFDGRVFGSGETVYFLCMKPAYYHCAASGGNYGSQSGLSLSTDIAPPEVEWVAYMTLATIARRSLRLFTDQARDVLLRNMEQWKNAAYEYTRRYGVWRELQFRRRMPMTLHGQRW